MSNEYITVATTNNENGLFAVSKLVIERIAEIAATEVDGVKVADKTTFSTPVSCKIEDNAIFVAIAIRIKYGMNINDVSLAVQERISQALSQMLAMPTTDIDVSISGFIF